VYQTGLLSEMLSGTHAVVCLCFHDDPGFGTMIE
jgi:hypothetical protein